jgi:hypothetical protein
VFQKGTLPNSCERFPGGVALVHFVEKIQFILIRAQSVTGIIHAVEKPSADANPESFNGCLTPGLHDSTACVLVGPFDGAKSALSIRIETQRASGIGQVYQQLRWSYLTYRRPGFRARRTSLCFNRVQLDQGVKHALRTNAKTRSNGPTQA